MDPLTTRYTPCEACMSTENIEPMCRRCYHEEGCNHKKDCGCSNFTSPSLTHSKIGVVLHLQWTQTDGTKHNIDVDVSVPSMATTTSFDGDIRDVQDYLCTNTPVGWLGEYKKCQTMTSARAYSTVKTIIKLRLINRHTVMASQVRL